MHTVHNPRAFPTEKMTTAQRAEKLKSHYNNLQMTSFYSCNSQMHDECYHWAKRDIGTKTLNKKDRRFSQEIFIKSAKC